MNKDVNTISASRKEQGRVERFLKKNFTSWLYIVPVVLGIVLFTVIPMITSLSYAFRSYNPTLRGEDKYGGFTFGNFVTIFTAEPDGIWDTFRSSIGVTFGFTIISLALQIIGSYGVALFLNQKTKGIQGFRILYYLPNLIPAVAGTMLWANMTDDRGGYLNSLLDIFGLSFPFYSDPNTVLPTLLIINIFTWGGTAIMWLSQMQNIPKEMYESAELDGANYFTQTIKITIPMSTSMMFYVIVTSMIGGIQAFTNVYPLYSRYEGEAKLNFIVVYIYNNAFGAVENGMSMACALAWVLFLIIAAMTFLLFKTSKKWVYYGEEM